MADAALAGRFFQYDAYLGYTDRDGAWATQFARRLRSDGLHLLTSPARLEHALADARHLLLVVPAAGLPASARSTHSLVGFDARWSPDLGQRRCVVPLLRRPEALPQELTAYTALDVKSFESLETVYPVLLRTLRGPADPTPAYQGDLQRRLGDELEQAQAQLDRLSAAACDPATRTQVESFILQLQRQMRDLGDLTEGLILSGRYRLLERVGVGGFATVWRAWDRHTRQVVALKILHPQHLRDEARVERFFRGAREMADLDHPNVVRVLERRARDGAASYFVMEYVEGSDLHALVLQRRLSRLQILDCLTLVAEALNYAHGRGIVHRDVKPGNVLVSPDGRVKLTDFDLVWAAGERHNLSTGALGTFVYAAPEQSQPGADGEARRDVYGLGMTALFALHGADLQPSMLFEREAFVGELPIPDAAKGVLLRAIDLKPERRFGTVAAFVGALSAALDG